MVFNINIIVLLLLELFFLTSAHPLTHLCNDNHHDASFSSCETRRSLQTHPIPFFFFFLENQTTNLSVVLNKNTKSCINITQYTTCQVPVFSPWDASLRTCEPQHRWSPLLAGGPCMISSSLSDCGLPPGSPHPPSDKANTEMFVIWAGWNVM